MAKHSFLYHSEAIVFKESDFFFASYPNAKLILFEIDNTVARRYNGAEVKFWTHHFSSERLEKIFTEAYGRLSKYQGLANSNIILNRIKNCFHHEIAYALAQKIAFDVLINDLSDSNICFFLPNCFDPNALNPYELNGFEITYFTRLKVSWAQLKKYLRILIDKFYYRISHKDYKSVDAKYILQNTLLLAQPLLFPIYILASPFYIFINTQITFVKYSIYKKGRSNCKVVFITVEDSGTLVNLNPCREIVRELKKKSAFPIVITSLSVLKNMPLTGSLVLNVRFFNLFVSSLNNDACEIAHFINSNISKDQDQNFIDNWFRLNFDIKLKFLRQVELCLDPLLIKFKKHTTNSILTIYESLPLSIACGVLAKERGLGWTGFFPILIGDKPDANHFLADLHLLYGTQLKDILVKSGVDEASCVVTGSPTYDVFHFRKEESFLNISDQVKALISSGKRIVVVLTEAFPDPFTEIGPILDALCENKTISVVLKIHPADDVNLFRKYLMTKELVDRIKIIESCDLYQLFSVTSLVIGTISNAIIGASILKVPVLICDFSNKTKVINFVTEGICPGCFQVKELKDDLEHLLGMTDDELKRYYEKNYWNIARFNGPNDGKSAERISQLLLM